LSSRELGAALYGPDPKLVTVRAEISRLRRLLGPILAASPYRLDAEVTADFARVERMLERGAPTDAAASYRGPLLPSSSAPGVVRARRRIDDAVGEGALAEDGAEPYYAWAATPVQPPAKRDISGASR
jgi:hypothetical protein